MTRRGLRAGALALCLSGAALAVDASCASQAAARHGVNEALLAAVLRVEAETELPVIVQEADGSLDIGAGLVGRFRVADLERAGIVPASATMPCRIAHTTAWHLARMQLQHGNTWDAVGAFASQTTYYAHRYQILVHNALVRVGALQGHLRRVPSLRPSESPDAPGAGDLVIYQVVIQDP